MSALDAVLSRIDQDIDQSVERLFALLRIASVSTDPAFAPQCRAAKRGWMRSMATMLMTMKKTLLTTTGKNGSISLVSGRRPVQDDGNLPSVRDVRGSRGDHG